MPDEHGKLLDRVEGPQAQRLTVELRSGKVIISRLIPRDIPFTLVAPAVTITIEPR